MGWHPHGDRREQRREEQHTLPSCPHGGRPDWLEVFEENLVTGVDLHGHYSNVYIPEMTNQV